MIHHQCISINLFLNVIHEICILIQTTSMDFVNEITIALRAAEACAPHCIYKGVIVGCYSVRVTYHYTSPVVEGNGILVYSALIYQTLQKLSIFLS